MAIKYLDANRIRGTATERTALSGSTAPQTSWKEIGRSTLTSAGDVLDTGTITAKDNLMLLIIGYKSGNGQIEDLRFNGDTGSNYAARFCETGTSDWTEVSADSIELGIDSEDDEFAVLNVRNIAGKEKLVIGHTVARQGGTGTGTAPTRLEVVGKWANTSNQITRVTLTNPHSGNLDTGSELVVLGCDDDEADSGTNFWQELDSSEITSTGDVLNTSTFAAKKYLFVQFRATYTGDANSTVNFNSDTGSNYAQRNSWAGGSDGTSINQTKFSFGDSSVHDGLFSDMEIINVSNKEKLIISHQTAFNNGNSAPNRAEQVAKWTNTSAQITSVQFNQSNSGSYTGARARVWGSD